MTMYKIADAHVEALRQACEMPGGYSRPFLKALLDVVQKRFGAMRPVSTSGEDYQVRHRIEQRSKELQRLRGIKREAVILLEGIPTEFDEAANELAGWLEEDPMLENEARRKLAQFGRV